MKQQIIKVITKSILLLTVIWAVACSEDDLEPEFTLTASSNQVLVDEEVTFTITGSSETFAIFTGDTGHEFEKSHLVIVGNKDVDLEEVMLTQDSLQVVTVILEDALNAYNADLGPGATIVDVDAVIVKITEMVGVKYTHAVVPEYELMSFIGLPHLKFVVEEVLEHFENNSTLFAPEGGFAYGDSIDRLDKIYSYSYALPGTYTVTVIGSNIGSKTYSGSGYMNNRNGKYEIDRAIREITIQVD